MSIKHELIPKRRFKEFENADAWEQRKLGEITEKFEYGLNAAATDFDGVNQYLRITDIDDETREFNKTSLTSPDTNLDSAENYILKQGDILFARTGASVGKTYQYKESDGRVYYAGFLIRARLLSGFNVGFIFQNTLTKRYENFISITSQRSGQPGVNAQEYASFKLLLPKFEEQEKIADLFTNLDNLITLHQRKLSKLRILKSAYLSEIIPEEGKLNPKRRFPGFTEDWEKKKISDMFKVTRGQVLSMSLTSPIKDETNKYPVYSSQTKNDGLMGYYSEYLFDTAITWTTDGANAGTVNFRKGKFFSTNVNGVLLSNDGYCNKAVSEILNLVTYKYVSKVGNPKLMNNVMEEIIISVPKDKNEMKIISDFLMTFDKRIIYLEEKIKKLEDLKRSYLNEMFV